MPIAAALRHHYTTPGWRAARARVIERANGRCEWCDRPAGEDVLTASGGSSGTWFDEVLGIWRRSPIDVVGLVFALQPREVLIASVPPRRSALRHVQLGVAHLNHVAGDDREENLAALCRRCHLLYDGPHHRTTHRLRRERETGQLRLELMEAS